jgi:hypothetical protein
MGSEHRGTRIACVTVEDCHKIEQDKKLLKDSVCVKIKMCTALQYKDINCRRGRAVRGWQTWTQGVGGLMEREGCGWGWVGVPGLPLLLCSVLLHGLDHGYNRVSYIILPIYLYVQTT